MIRLNGTAESLQLITSVAGSIDYDASYTDITSSADTPSDTSGNIATATTTPVVAAPAASTIRQIAWLNFYNAGTVYNLLTIQKNTGSARVLFKINLAPGESVDYTSNRGFVVSDANGKEKWVMDGSTAIKSGRLGLVKSSSTITSNVQRNSLFSATGFPAAWATGSPGVNGRATNSASNGEPGSLPIWTVTSGLLYYMGASIVSSVANSVFQLFDVLWVNSGLSVTLLTSQAITPVALPARDVSGTTNGGEVQAAVLVTSALGAAASTITITYTNSAGTGSRTATASVLASAAAGSLFVFTLQAGDTGIRSVQAWIGSASMISGTLSLVLFTEYDSVPTPMPVSSITPSQPSKTAGRRVYDGACLLGAFIQTVTTQAVISGALNFEER